MRKPYHIRERSPGHWAIVFSEPDPATGTRKRKWYSFKGTKKEAQLEAARLLTERAEGTAVDPKKIKTLTISRSVARICSASCFTKVP